MAGTQTLQTHNKIFESLIYSLPSKDTHLAKHTRNFEVDVYIKYLYLMLRQTLLLFLVIFSKIFENISMDKSLPMHMPTSKITKCITSYVTEVKLFSRLSFQAIKLRINHPFLTSTLVMRFN